MPKAALYLSHDGILEPLGESQVLAYLKPLAQTRHVSLITFEKERDFSKIGSTQKVVSEAKIFWWPLKYRKGLVGFAIGFSQALLLSIYICFIFRVGLVHARSYPMSFLALCLKKILGTSFVFDTRGFWVDERRESGQWTKKSITYKILKKIEARLFSTADVVVSLTQAGAISMSELTTAPVSVVPTCVDTTIFRLRDPGPKPYVMGYFGSTGLWYSFEPVVHLFKAIKTIRPESRMIVLTRDPAGPLKKMFENTASSVDFGQADRVGVAEAMNQVLLSPFFFRPFESKVASAPTRFAELLARGLPVVTNGICGDLAAAIQSEPSLGFCIDVEKVDWPKLAEMVLLLAENNVLDKERRIFVEKNFSLDRGVAEYKRIWGSFA